MKIQWLITPGVLLSAAGLLWLSAALHAEPPKNETTDSKEEKKSAPMSKMDEKARVPLDVARDRAKLMHDIYAATLDVVHHHYFHGDRAVIPARAMEEIFSEIKLQSRADAHWISVSLKPMSLNHEPKTDFEKRAAKEIAAGKTEFEAVEDGFYRRAGAIRMSDSCVGCHGGFFKEPTKGPKFSGLVISLPVNGDAKIENNPAPKETAK